MNSHVVHKLRAMTSQDQDKGEPRANVLVGIAKKEIPMGLFCLSSESKNSEAWTSEFHDLVWQSNLTIHSLKFR